METEEETDADCDDDQDWEGLHDKLIELATVSLFFLIIK